MYAATSVGLFFTERLNGHNTVWRKENNIIGNALGEKVYTRKDGLVAVATHGNGLFSAKFPMQNEIPQMTLSVAYQPDDIVIERGESERVVDIEGLFVDQGGATVDVRVVNPNPREIVPQLENGQLRLSFPEGTISQQTTLALIASVGIQQVSLGLTVSERPIYEQAGIEVLVAPSTNNPAIDFFLQIADDFEVPKGQMWGINSMFAYGNTTSLNEITSVSVAIYQDNDGRPGAEVFAIDNIQPLDPLNANLGIKFPNAVSLSEGIYWISVYANVESDFFSSWNWASQEWGIGSPGHSNFSSDGSGDWEFGVDGSGRSFDQRFQILGTVSNSVGGATSPNKALADIEVHSTLKIYPNPSSSLFHFDFDITNSKNVEMGSANLRVYNSMGGLVHEESKHLRDVETAGFTWDASGEATGYYFGEILFGGKKSSFKLLKSDQ